MKKKVIAIVIAVVVILGGVGYWWMNRFEYNDENAVGNTTSNLYNEGLFCESDGYVYFANPYDDYKLYKMTLGGGEVEKLCDDKSSYINVCNGYIYYKRFNVESSVEKVFKGTLYGVFRLKDGDKKPDELFNGIVDSVVLKGNTLYFRYLKDRKEFCLSKVMIDGKEDGIILENDYTPISIYDNKMYFSETVDNHNLKSMSLGEERVSTISEGNFYMPVVTGKYIYFIDLNNDRKLSRMSKSSREVIVLSEDKCINYNVSEDSDVIFYQAENSKEDHKLVKMSADGSSRVDIISGDFKNISITSRYTYFIGTVAGEDILYRTETTGVSIAEIFRPSEGK